MSNLQMRIITAAFLIAISLMATWAGGMVFRLFILIAGAATYHEWQILTLTRQTTFSRGIGWLFYGLIAVLLLIYQPLGTVLAVLLFTAALLAVLGQRKAGWWTGGLLYALAAPVILSFIREGTAGLNVVLYLYAVVWACDSAAYFIGRTLAGPKLVPKISPNKTWSGAIGGILVSIGAAFAIHWMMMPDFNLPAPWIFISAFLLSIGAQIGDIGESWLKRYFNVKDSGMILPGHGGFMDRLDGLIVASVVLFLLIQILPFAIIP